MEGTPLPPYTWYTEAFYKRNGKPILNDIPPLNPAIKMCVHNYAWTGYPSAVFLRPHSHGGGGAGAG